MKILLIILSLFIITNAYADTLTVYPDAGTGNTTVDGSVQKTNSTTWSGARDATNGNTSQDTDSTGVLVQIGKVGEDPDYTYPIGKSIFTFDTSSLTAGATVSSAIMSVYGFSKADAGGNAYNSVLVASTPANNNAVVTEDFDQLGSTALSSVITYAGFSTSGYNDYTLNDLTEINKTGITALGVRNKNYDIDNVAPTGVAEVGPAARTDCYFADNTGTTNDPKLVVTYTLPAAGSKPTHVWYNSYDIHGGGF